VFRLRCELKSVGSFAGCCSECSWFFPVVGVGVSVAVDKSPVQEEFCFTPKQSQGGAQEVPVTLG